ncbi:MAG: hypothetical protein AUJ85_07055 [Elusimicrobia bacterium CG1_02_37_114]|nr:MAG: hypothetical protein AUJ85_07055 [Elusimicrobia bacterium CG1_02_37_114]PIV52301.1 MAG: hypothetical protein COS17_09840 [Elusimicrobia bacterium CG02_land_8_20_14_3_00_37_13]PIZ13841.1 MAG: hypothetical protein COY53_02740 [Elusimicrobia bacterium CG_4_10_14_0_8_um_filter_37_32]
MYELLKQKLKRAITAEDKINKLREFLQTLILKIMFDHQTFENLAFVGGTALRILYGVRRYSEDLDFSLIKRRNYSFESLINDLLYELKHYGLKVESVKKENNVVNICMIKFPALLNELSISGIKEQKLSIKLEIDTNPPKGWNTALTPISESYVFAIKHFDLPSLYATKLHACFFRRYTKGRDFYDLVWYLGKKTVPNFILLNNAVKQTEKKDFKIDSRNLKTFLIDKLKGVDFNYIRKDVERFLEDKNELKMLDKKIIMQIIK